MLAATRKRIEARSPATATSAGTRLGAARTSLLSSPNPQRMQLACESAPKRDPGQNSSRSLKSSAKHQKWGSRSAPIGTPLETKSPSMYQGVEAYPRWGLASLLIHSYCRIQLGPQQRRYLDQSRTTARKVTSWRGGLHDAGLHDSGLCSGGQTILLRGSVIFDADPGFRPAMADPFIHSIFAHFDTDGHALTRNQRYLCGTVPSSFSVAGPLHLKRGTAPSQSQLEQITTSARRTWRIAIQRP